MKLRKPKRRPQSRPAATPGSGTRDTCGVSEASGGQGKFEHSRDAGHRNGPIGWRLECLARRPRRRGRGSGGPMPNARGAGNAKPGMMGMGMGMGMGPGAPAGRPGMNPSDMARNMGPGMGMRPPGGPGGYWPRRAGWPGRMGGPGGPGRDNRPADFHFSGRSGQGVPECSQSQGSRSPQRVHRTPRSDGGELRQEPRTVQKDLRPEPLRFRASMNSPRSSRGIRSLSKTHPRAQDVSMSFCEKPARTVVATSCEKSPCATKRKVGA